MLAFAYYLIFNTPLLILHIIHYFHYFRHYILFYCDDSHSGCWLPLAIYIEWPWFITPARQAYAAIIKGQPLPLAHYARLLMPLYASFHFRWPLLLWLITPLIGRIHLLAIMPPPRPSLFDDIFTPQIFFMPLRHYYWFPLRWYAFHFAAITRHLRHRYFHCCRCHYATTGWYWHYSYYIEP